MHCGTEKVRQKSQVQQQTFIPGGADCQGKVVSGGPLADSDQGVHLAFRKRKFTALAHFVQPVLSSILECPALELQRFGLWTWTSSASGPICTSSTQVSWRMDWTWTVCWRPGSLGPHKGDLQLHGVDDISMRYSEEAVHARHLAAQWCRSW